jgi:hypothetical protein
MKRRGGSEGSEPKVTFEVDIKLEERKGLLSPERDDGMHPDDGIKLAQTKGNDKAFCDCGAARLKLWSGIVLVVFLVLAVVARVRSRSTEHTDTLALFTAHGPPFEARKFEAFLDLERWYSVQERHLSSLLESDKPEVVFMGDGIIEGLVRMPLVPGQESRITEEKEEVQRMWAELFGKYKPINLGLGGDRVSDLGWRLSHGLVTGEFTPDIPNQPTPVLSSHQLGAAPSMASMSLITPPSIAPESVSSASSSDADTNISLAATLPAAPSDSYSNSLTESRKKKEGESTDGSLMDRIKTTNDSLTASEIPGAVPKTSAALPNATSIASENGISLPGAPVSVASFFAAAPENGSTWENLTNTVASFFASGAPGAAAPIVAAATVNTSMTKHENGTSQEVAGNTTGRRILSERHKPFDGLRLVVLHIGGNDLLLDSPHFIASQIINIVLFLRTHAPKTSVLIMSVLPRGSVKPEQLANPEFLSVKWSEADKYFSPIAKVNADLKSLVHHPHEHPLRDIEERVDSALMELDGARGAKKTTGVFYVDCGSEILQNDSTGAEWYLTRDVMRDFHHLTLEGYRRLGQCLQPIVDKIITLHKSGSAAGEHKQAQPL